MFDPGAILNETEAREAKAALAEIEESLSSKHFFDLILAELPAEVVGKYQQALISRRNNLTRLLGAYEAARRGDYAELITLASNDPGLVLIVARITRGYSQKELARLLGLKEQQIQRYESDRYRSISISNYRRIAQVLGVRWEMKLSDKPDRWFGSGWKLATEIRADDVKKVVKHAKQYHWFDDDSPELAGEESYNYLQRYISDQLLNYGSPTLLRTGLNVDDMSNDLLLVAWRARVTRVAETIAASQKQKYSLLDIVWLRDLVRLSQLEDGPARVTKFLLSHGIILVVEPHIPGLKLDGAAFLMGETPVIGMTIRRDTLDNFWFTLLHELAHVVLHYQTGLRLGFFDDVEKSDIDEIEQEANAFASDVLIPPERWIRSPARITKSAAVIEKFAKEANVHPAVVFGRIQKERGDYSIFSDRTGRGLVRKFFFEAH